MKERTHPFSIYVNNMLINSEVNPDEITQYSHFTPDYYIIAISGNNDYAYIQKDCLPALLQRQLHPRMQPGLFQWACQRLMMNPAGKSKQANLHKAD